jgi:DNA-binding CsgD family transcriptional regulator
MGVSLKKAKSNHIGTLAFGLFVLWLLAFPMEGVLLNTAKPKELHSIFIIFHLIGVVSVASLLYKFPNLVRLSSLATTSLTALFPFAGKVEVPLMGALGFFSGALSVYIAASLGRFERPTTVAAKGLIAGNLTLIVLTIVAKELPNLIPLLTVFIGVGLLTSLLLPKPKPSARDGKDLKRETLLVFFLYLLLGNSYLYLHAKSPLGLDNLIYGAAVLGALWLKKKREKILLPITVLLMGFSVISLSIEGKLLSLALIQSSAGLADLFTLNLLFKGGSSLRRAGFIVGAMVGGISAGLPFRELFEWSSTAPLIGNFVISVLFALSYISTDKISNLEKNLKTLGLSRRDFSKREWQVLDGVYKEKTLKEIAQEIGISESSVKTYLGRVYRKVGVKGKRELLEKLRSSQK